MTAIGANEISVRVQYVKTYNNLYMNNDRGFAEGFNPIAAFACTYDRATHTHARIMSI